MGHLFSGVVLVGLGVWGMFAWWDSFGMVMRGFAPFALLAVGLVAILSGLFRADPPARRRDREDHPPTNGGRDVRSWRNDGRQGVL